MVENPSYTHAQARDAHAPPPTLASSPCFSLVSAHPLGHQKCRPAPGRQQTLPRQGAEPSPSRNSLLPPHPGAGHTLGNSAAWLHAHLHANPSNWTARTALAVHTPLGLALPRHWQPLVGPLVPHRPVQSLADFSARPSAKPSSGGNRSRCFADMLVCSGDPELQSINVWQVSSRAAALFAASHALCACMQGS